MGLRARQQCAQQLFIFYVCRKRVDFGATRRALPAHDGPAVWTRLGQFRNAIVTSSLLAGPTFRAGFRTRGDANGTFGRGHLFLKDYIIISHARDRSRETGPNRRPRST